MAETLSLASSFACAVVLPLTSLIYAVLKPQQSTVRLAQTTEDFDSILLDLPFCWIFDSNLLDLISDILEKGSL